MQYRGCEHHCHTQGAPTANTPGTGSVTADPPEVVTTSGMTAVSAAFVGDSHAHGPLALHCFTSHLPTWLPVLSQARLLRAILLRGRILLAK